MKLQRVAINEEGFIFDPETGNSFTTNSTGLFIIKLLKDGLSEEEIIKRLCEEYQVSQEEAQKDLLEFIETLKLHHLL